MDFLSSEDFTTGSDFITKVYMVWGILSVDRSGVSFWDMENYGTLVVDDEFDPSNSTNQQYLVDVCNVSIPEMADDLAIYDLSELICPMVDFKAYAEANVGSFPVPQSEFHSQFYSFLQDSEFGTNTMTNMLAGVKDGNVSYISLKIPVDVYVTASGTTKKPVYDAWETFVRELNYDAPDGVNRGFQTCQQKEWEWMRVEQALVTGAIQGVGIALPTAFLVILIFTRNFKISLFAIITIFEILLSVVNVII